MEPLLSTSNSGHFDLKGSNLPMQVAAAATVWTWVHSPVGERRRTGMWCLSPTHRRTPITHDRLGPHHEVVKGGRHIALVLAVERSCCGHHVVEREVPFSTLSVDLRTVLARTAESSSLGTTREAP